MPSKKQAIRSFVCREGRVTPAQAKALKDLFPRWGLSLETSGFWDLDQIFGRQGPKVLEIGFGGGESLLETALLHPEQDFLGIEVYEKGVGKLLLGISASGLNNIRVASGDAVQILQEKIPEGSLSKIQIFFSDPWPKKRHHKRRLIQKDFIELSFKKLIPGGIFHLATDWEDYAEHMMSVLSASPLFRNQAGDKAFSERPEIRPITKYEKRALRLGHGIWDLIFEACP